MNFRDVSYLVFLLIFVGTTRLCWKVGQKLQDTFLEHLPTYSRPVFRGAADLILFEILNKAWNTVDNVHADILLLTRYVEAK